MNADELRILICDTFLGGDTEFPLDGSTHLIEEGICDSLGLVRLAQALETQVDGLRVPDQDITHENFASIDAIQAYLGRAQG